MPCRRGDSLMPQRPYVLPLSQCRDIQLAGGKAVNLARMIEAQLPVPDGFVVTTEAFIQSGGADAKQISSEISAQIIDAYRQMGSPIVAVRSSATTEDLDIASMAGQYETILNVKGADQLLEAIARCWRSIDSERLHSYFKRHGVRGDNPAMAVIVQQMIPPESAGVNGLVLRQAQPGDKPKADPQDVRIAPDMVPPPAGRRERRARTIFIVAALIWACYLFATFVLPPDSLYNPTIRVLDGLLWPLVRTLGKPAAVAVIAAAMAALTMVGQRLLTDNRRLLAVRRRAKRLRRQATDLPEGSPRRRTIDRLVSYAQMRILAAALVPLGVLLGPMIMTFVWLPKRVDPASWNPRPGATVYVTAGIDGEYLKPISIEHDSRLRLDGHTSAQQQVPAIRQILTNLLDKYRRDHLAGKDVPPEMIADLGKYLDSPIGTQELTWTIRTPQRISDRYDVSLHAAECPPFFVPVLIGDRYPSELDEIVRDGKSTAKIIRSADEQSPIRYVRVSCREKRQLGDRVFWAPLQSPGWSWLAESSAAKWDAGWLLTYIGAYLLVLFPLRRILSITWNSSSRKLFSRHRQE